MAEITLAEKACKVIEFLVSDDLCQSLEYNDMVKNKWQILEKDVKIIYQKIVLIYEFSHVANKPICSASHQDWIEKLERMYRMLIVEGEISE